MTTPLLSAVQRLQSALDSLAIALAKGDSHAVLAAEEPLASAANALAAVPRLTAADAAGLPQAIAAVRASIRRCESLGESASAFARAIFPQPSYARRDFAPLGGDRSRLR